MEFVKPPTDNLYKFISLAGATTIVAVVLTVSNDITTLQKAVWDLADNRLVLSARLIQSEHELRTIETLDGQDEKKTSDEHVVALARAHGDVSIIEMQIRSNDQRVDQIMRNVKFRYQLLVSFALVGLVPMIAGFCFWYHRVQKLQDQILKKEAEAALK